MPSQKIQLVNGEMYHIVLRSVGDTTIFRDENDYYRGIFSIYEFNNEKSAEIWKRRRDRIIEKKKEKFGGSPTSPELLATDKRDKLVEIFAFSLMPNHIHLFVKQLKDSGITKFMQKVGGGIANYFNKKYNRKGHLFNQFKAVRVKDDEQLHNVFVYIHANRISLVEPGWKEKGIKKPKKVIEFLENYKWHSYPDYIGKKNFQSVTSRDFLLEMMDGARGCKQAMKEWVRYKGKIEEFDDTVFE